MSLSQIQSRALLGLSAPSVVVEVHLANGLPSFTLVGLADVEVKEARERVRSAIINAGFEFPHNKRITVNLAPADLPKDSGRFDLPIALGVLAASGQINNESLKNYEFAGELSLSGQLRPVRGALAMSLALHEASTQVKLVLPQESAQEAALVPSSYVIGVAHLSEVAHAFLPGKPSQANLAAHALSRLQPKAETQVPHYPELAEVKGQTLAKRVLEIAAAGGHSLLMVGPPGAGKSMLAQRFAGLLPPMTQQEALESAAVASLAGQFHLQTWGQRPTRSPHHTASAIALVGGGVPPRPGEISLAHHGILFLDELPEFPRMALEALREPLESGHISIARATTRAQYPAKFQLIAAMNPCPCGYLGSTQKACRCSPEQINRYQGKLSGPLLDRIDLHIEVSAMSADDLLSPKQKELEIKSGQKRNETSLEVQQRCAQAREIAQQRQGKPNSALQGKELEEQMNLSNEARLFLMGAATRLGWSARVTHRSLKVARTIADLAQAPETQIAHVAEAIQYRRALRSPQ